MKAYLCILVIVSILLAGCSGSPGYWAAEKLTSAGVGVETSLSEIWAVHTKNEAASIGNTILYISGTEYSECYMRKEEESEKLNLCENEGAYYEVSASKKYFYVTFQDEDTDEWYLFVLDRKGETVRRYDSPFSRFFVKQDVVFGYYDGNEDGGTTMNAFDDATHYMKEDQFLKKKEIRMDDWTRISGDDVTIAGVRLYKKKPDGVTYGVEYYSDEKQMEVLEDVEYLLLCGGEISSDYTLKSESYLKQVQKIFGKREKNMNLYSFQTDSAIYGVCNAYTGSGGMLQLFTEDYKKSFSFHYDEGTDRIVMDREYSDRELVYWDGRHLVYHTGRGLYYEDTETGEGDLFFESGNQIEVCVAHGIVIAYDRREGEDGFIEGEPSATKLWDE